MMKSRFLMLFLISFLFSISFLCSGQEQVDPNDFNVSEHSFFGQDFLNNFIALGMFLCIVLFFIPFIIGLVIAFWIYNDANKRGKEGIIWAIIFIMLSIMSIFGLIMIIILLIVWLATRPPVGGNITKKRVHPDRRCPNCGRVIPWEAEACPYCTKKFD